MQRSLVLRPAPAVRPHGRPAAVPLAASRRPRQLLTVAKAAPDEATGVDPAPAWRADIERLREAKAKVAISQREVLRKHDNLSQWSANASHAFYDQYFLANCNIDNAIKTLEDKLAKDKNKKDLLKAKKELQQLEALMVEPQKIISKYT